MVSHRLKVLLAALCFVFNATFWVSSQTMTGNTIAGKVRSQSGSTLPNVLVQLESGNGVLLTQVFTTNEGDFAFTGLEGASFILVVNEPNYDPLAQRVELSRTAATRPGETVRVDLVLTSKARPATHAPGRIFSQEIPVAALEAYKTGVKLLAEHKSAEGIAALNEALRVMVNYFDAHFALALEFVRLSRHNDAIAELEKARAINPNDSRVYYTFGLVLSEQKKYALAARVLAEAWRLNPSDHGLLVSRGTCLIELALSLDPLSAAVTAERDATLSLARSELLKALELSGGKSLGAHLQLARLYEKIGERRKAAEELEQYLKLAPDDKRAENIRAAIKALRNLDGVKKP